MSSTVQPIDTDAEPFSGRLAGRAVVAGIIGGILIDLFLFFMHAPFPGVYQYIASVLVGKAAFSSTAYIWLGVVIHFGVAIGWAILYAYVANRMHVLHRWTVGGLVFGIIVMIVMEIIQLVAKIAQPITVRSGIVALIAHVAFYGWPVAWFVGRSVRPPVIATLGLNVPKEE